MLTLALEKKSVQVLLGGKELTKLSDLKKVFPDSEFYQRQLHEGWVNLMASLAGPRHVVPHSLVGLPRLLHLAAPGEGKILVDE